MTITTYTDREIALRQQLAAATQFAQLNGEIAAELKADKLALEAAIEASKLFAAPVVALDVLKDAQRYQWLRDNSASISWNPSRFNSEIVGWFFTQWHWIPRV